MESSEDDTYLKSEKASSSNKEQANVHLYPDWATIQAYYGPGVPLPPSYFPSGIVTGHVPHPHVWTPSQPMMPPYGVPYSTIYSPGVVYAHPAVPLVATPLSTQLPSNSSDNMDQSLTKKLKRLDSVTVQVVNDNAEVDGEGSAHLISQSVECDNGVSSNASDDNTAVLRSQGRSDSLDELSTGIKIEDNDGTEALFPLQASSANVTSSMVLGISEASENVAGKPVSISNGKAETSVTCDASPAGGGLSFEVWIQDERQLKRERRKQANRESARRSRLKKQAETEDLMERYETLKVENIALKYERNQLMEESEKLRAENAALMEKLNGAEIPHPEEKVLDEIGPDLDQANVSENGSMRNNSISVNENSGREFETLGKSNSEMKLEKFEPRAGPVVTGS